MPYGFYISAEGAHAQSKRMEVLANNLANVDTVGFKRDLALFQARYAEAIQRGQGAPGTGSIDDLGGGVIVAGTKTDFSLGPFKTTGAPLDMAIDGNGFFVVRKGDQEFLTRAGNFQLNTAGELVTAEGYPVLSEQNAPIIPLPGWQFAAGGGIDSAGEVDYLALVRPESLDDLVKVGENLYQSRTTPVAVPRGERRVINEHLEASSVKPTTEMMELIETSRAFEANVNMIRSQDSMIGALVSRVLREA